MSNPTLDELDLLHANICQALGDPKRILILYALHKRPRHVTELANDLDIPQPTISRHLRVLRQRHLVSTEREGTAVLYTIKDKRIIDVLDAMRAILRDSLAQQSDMLA